MTAAAAPRLLRGLSSGAARMGLREHRDVHGPMPRPKGDLIDLVEASGLTGRGGAGFPAATKLRAVAGRRGRKIVVVNAAEGEPASAKDKVLMGWVPHLVLDGALAVAGRVGAERVIVALGEEAAAAIAATERAVAERGERGAVLEVAPVPQRFVAGEESALVRFLSGGPALPTFRGPMPFERGVDGRPTLVANAETLAQVALVARHGAEWFRAAGTAREPGTALVTVGGAVRSPGVIEVPLGTPLRGVLDRVGGPSEPLRALLVGGYHGGLVGDDDVDRLALSDESLRPAGAALGARAIVAMPRSACALAESARIVRYLADESAGQCGPCVHGLGAIADGLGRMHAGDRRAGADVARWVDMVRGRGACRHPDGAARLVASVLSALGPEIRDHAEHGCHARPLAARGAR